MISKTQILPTPDPTRKRFGSLPGRKADRERNRKIADIVNEHDGRWWNGSSQWKREPLLSRICSDLDEAHIAVPSSWLEGRTPQLLEFGVDADSWHEAVDLGFRQLVIDKIRYHLRRCLKTVYKGARRIRRSRCAGACVRSLRLSSSDGAAEARRLEDWRQAGLPPLR